MLDIYYIEKVGIYNHGVMWIGGCKDDGIKEVALLSLADRDDHHTYELFKYNAWTTKRSHGCCDDGIKFNGEKVEIN